MNETESKRLAALFEYNVLDTEYEKDYDDLVELASKICNVPISLISLIDKDRQWFKAKKGLESAETPRDVAFCNHAIMQDHIMEIQDATKDQRFVNNPLVLKDPEIRFYAGAPLINSDGYKLGTLCVIDKVPRELTAEQRRALEIISAQVMKLLEIRLAHKKEETLKNRLAIQNKRLEELNQLKTKMFSIISHDLRVPVANLSTLLGMVMEQQSGEHTPLFKMVNQSIDDTLIMMENLLVWAKSQMGEKVITEEPIDFFSLTAEVIKMLQPLADKKSIGIINQVNNQLLTNADKEGIRLVIRNLVSNAIKFTPEHGLIYVSARKEDKHILFKVEDNGVGIPSEKLPGLFNRSDYYTTNGTNNEKGTGLGLILCKSTIENSGGTIWAESTPGEGTTIYFTVPVK